MSKRPPAKVLFISTVCSVVAIVFLFFARILIESNSPAKKRVLTNVEIAKKDIVFLDFLCQISTIEMGNDIQPSYFFESSPHPIDEKRQKTALDILKPDDYGGSPLKKGDHLYEEFHIFEDWLKKDTLEHLFKLECAGKFIVTDIFSDIKLPYRFYIAPDYRAFVASNGPNRVPDIDPLDAIDFDKPEFINKIYDPTNGLNSYGDIISLEADWMSIDENEAAEYIMDRFCVKSP